MNKTTCMTNVGLAGLCSLLVLAGCNKKETPEEQPVASSPAATPVAPIDPSTAAAVSGTVKFEGAAPKPATIDMSQDANCKGSNKAENVVASDGHLANVFVYVKEGLGNRTFDAPKEEITLDQSGWNESQAPQSSALEKNFAREEIMMPVKCNQHPWMKMYLNVVKSPFYAVSGADGKYELKGLPPGDYTLAFVHEKLGEKTQKVTLAAKDSKTIDVSFQP